VAHLAFDRSILFEERLAEDVVGRPEIALHPGAGEWGARRVVGGRFLHGGHEFGIGWVLEELRAAFTRIVGGIVERIDGAVAGLVSLEEARAYSQVGVVRGSFEWGGFRKVGGHIYLESAREENVEDAIPGIGGIFGIHRFDPCGPVRGRRFLCVWLRNRAQDECRDQTGERGTVPRLVFLPVP
jgi:hypothetical protein